MGNSTSVINNTGMDFVLLEKRGKGESCNRYDEIEVKDKKTVKVNGWKLRDKIDHTGEVSFLEVCLLENSTPAGYVPVGLELYPDDLINSRTITIIKARLDVDGKLVWVKVPSPRTQ